MCAHQTGMTTTSPIGPRHTGPASRESLWCSPITTRVTSVQLKHNTAILQRQFLTCARILRSLCHVCSFNNKHCANLQSQAPLQATIQNIPYKIHESTYFSTVSNMIISQCHISSKLFRALSPQEFIIHQDRPTMSDAPFILPHQRLRGRSHLLRYAQTP